MKKSIYLILTACILLSLCGCTTPANSEKTPVEFTSEPTVSETAEATLPAVAVVQRPMAAISVPVVTEKETAEDGTLLYTCSYQDITLTLPESEVADKIILDFLNRTDIHEQSSWVLDEAKDTLSSNASALPFWSQIMYTPARIDQSVISLYGSYSTYTGGAHGSSTCKAVTYDLLTGQVLTLDTVLTKNTDSNTITTMVCEALQEKEANGELFEDYKTIVSQLLQKDLKSYSDWYLSDAGLCFFFSPYEIGPYASGDIVAEIPYGKLTGILEDAFFPAEKDIAKGKLIVESFNAVDISKFTQIAELSLHKDGPMLLISTDTSVDDIRINTEFTTQQYSETYTVFAAAGLTPGDAIVIQFSPDTKLSISYSSGEETHTKNIEGLLG